MNKVKLLTCAKFGANVTIDCDLKRVIDSETGLDIRFSVAPSNPGKWLTLQPGNNTISYTEVGVVNTTMAWEFRPRKAA